MVLLEMITESRRRWAFICPLGVLLLKSIDLLAEFLQLRLSFQISLPKVFELTVH